MTTHRTLTLAPALALALGLGLAATTACTGTITDGDEPGGGGELTPPDCTERGPRMLRRLTSNQVRATLAAAFQDPNVPVTEVFTDPVVNGFKVDATQAVIRDLDSQLVMGFAEGVADWAVANKLGQLTSCQTVDAACARTFVETLGKKLYREPVPPGSVEGYVALLTGEASFADGARVVIATMLQSPYFLYRRELGELGDDGLYHLTPYELASSLSYMLTGGPPDATLAAAAEQGRLVTREDLDRETRRLLSAGGDTAWREFVRSWLVVDDLLTRAKVDPGNQLTEAVRKAMLEETSRLFLDVLRSRGGLTQLLTANYTFVDQTLRGFYGLPGGGGAGFERVELPANSRAPGLLGQGSVLARHALAETSSPVQRGKLVFERLLCEHLPPPPPAAPTDLPPIMGAQTTRDRYEQHAANPSCAVCHDKIDPVGFAFEHYDNLGRRREQENGLPIDATGQIGTASGTTPLDGLPSLATALAGDQRAQACLTRTMAYFAYGVDGCSADAISAELASGDQSLEAIVLALVHAPHFATRTAD